MAQVVSLMTAEDLERVPSDVYCELIDGVLIEMSPPGIRHARVAAKVTGALLEAERMGLGLAFAEAGFIVRRGPDTVRAPDAFFVRHDKILAAGPPRAFSDQPPDLLVEVVSPYDTRMEIQTKVREWVEFGVRMVWVVNPDDRTAQVIRSLQDRVALTEEDVLDGAEVLPGFSFPVSELFG